MAIKFNTISRQTGLGPPAEAPYVPFPFQELASLEMATGRGRGKGQTGTKSPEAGKGLQSVYAFGQDIPVGEDEYIKNYENAYNSKVQEIADKAFTNPKDPSLPTEISKLRNTNQAERVSGSYANALENRKQIDELNTAVLGDKDYARSPHRYIDVEKKTYKHGLERATNPEIISSLDIRGDIARAAGTKHLDRYSYIDERFKGMEQNEHLSFNSEDYLNLANSRITSQGEDRFLVSIQAKGKSENRINSMLTSILSSPEIRSDLEQQLEYEEWNAYTKGREFDREKRYKELVNDEIQNYAISKYRSTNYEQSIKTLEDRDTFDFDLGATGYRGIGVSTDAVYSPVSGFPYKPDKPFKSIGEVQDVAGTTKGLKGEIDELTDINSASFKMSQGIVGTYDKMKISTGGFPGLSEEVKRKDAEGIEKTRKMLQLGKEGDSLKILESLSNDIKGYPGLKKVIEKTPKPYAYFTKGSDAYNASVNKYIKEVSKNYNIYGLTDTMVEHISKPLDKIGISILKAPRVSEAIETKVNPQMLTTKVSVLDKKGNFSYDIAREKKLDYSDAIKSKEYSFQGIYLPNRLAEAGYTFINPEGDKVIVHNLGSQVANDASKVLKELEIIAAGLETGEIWEKGVYKGKNPLMKLQGEDILFEDAKNYYMQLIGTALSKEL